MRCRHHSCLLVLRGNGGGGGDADDDASFQWRFIGSICKALMEPPTLETGSNSFYSPLHSYHRIVFYVQFFIFLFDHLHKMNAHLPQLLFLYFCLTNVSFPALPVSVGAGRDRLGDTICPSDRLKCKARCGFDLLRGHFR